MQSFSMQGQEREHHVNFLQLRHRGLQHFLLPEYNENSGKCNSITLSTHVECVVLLSRGKVDGYVDIELEVEKLEGKAGTVIYAEIKKYVADHNDGMKVSSLYIGQIKNKMSLEKRKNYNVGSGEGKVPICPQDKEEAILEAFKHFNLIQ